MSGNFSETTQSHIMMGSVLRCEAQKRGGDWTIATIDLNEFLGNNDGKWDPIGGNAFATHEEGSVSLDGVDLSARLQNCEGDWIISHIDLNPHITNDDGRLEWITRE